MAHLRGHTAAVKSVRWNPYESNNCVSVSYDMNVCWWHIPDTTNTPFLQRRWSYHTEFIHGIDWDINSPNRIATCAWDHKVVVFSILGNSPRI